MNESIFAVFYLLAGRFEEPATPYGRHWEEQETEELLTFVRLAKQEVERRGIHPPPPPVESIRITRTLRVFIGKKELKVRPMAKTVLILFLRHPEGIPLKQISDYREELAAYYRRISRSSNPATIEERIARMMDLFNNDLNVNIARVNKAVAMLVDQAENYRIEGRAGQPKRIRLNRNWVVWENELS